MDGHDLRRRLLHSARVALARSSIDLERQISLVLSQMTSVILAP